MAMTYVVDGAIITCSQGIGDSTVNKGSEWNLELHHKKILTIADNKPHKNIKPFKLCKSPQNPAVQAAKMNPAACNPVISKKWMKGKPDFYLKGQIVLNSECILGCIYSGIIKVKDDGQRK